jgi:hypothetical protein
MRTSVMNGLVTALRIPVHESYEPGGISDQIFAALEKDDDLYLDSLDYILHHFGGARSGALAHILEVGGSAWAVNAKDNSIERRVSQAEKNAMEEVSSSPDGYANELLEAWACAYGRQPNPSDAWDHAIKAVEEILIPIAIPNVTKPNLGGVAGELESSSHKWKLTLAPNGKLNAGETLAAMLRPIWPNPDRHGGGQGRRMPSQEEAEAVVHLAINIIAMCRNGGLSKLP